MINSDGEIRLIDIGSFKKIKEGDNSWEIELQGGGGNVTMEHDSEGHLIEKPVLHDQHWPAWHFTKEFCGR